MPPYELARILCVLFDINIDQCVYCGYIHLAVQVVCIVVEAQSNNPRSRAGRSRSALCLRRRPKKHVRRHATAFGGTASVPPYELRYLLTQMTTAKAIHEAASNKNIPAYIVRWKYDGCTKSVCCLRPRRFSIALHRRYF